MRKHPCYDRAPRRRVSSLAGAIMLACSVGVSSLTARQDAPAGLPENARAPQARKPATLTGRVIDGTTGAGVAHAAVELDDASRGLHIAVRADADGRFEAHVQTGRYLTRASADGYERSLYGEDSAGHESSPTPVVLRGDAPLEPIDVVIWPLGGIEGTIADAAGVPTSAVTVALHRWVTTRVRPRHLERVATTTPGSDGHYAFAALPSGDYVVVGTPFRRDGYAGFIQTFYPGTPLLSAAATVTVTPGADRFGVGFALARPKPGTLEGTIFGARPGETIAVTITNLDQIEFQRRDSVTPDAGGHFAVGDLAPGRYRVVARTISPLPPFGLESQIMFSTSSEVIHLAPDLRFGGTMSIGVAPRDGGPSVDDETVTETVRQVLRVLGGGRRDHAEIILAEGGVQRVVLTLRPGVTISGRLAADSLPASSREHVLATVVARPVNSDTVSAWNAGFPTLGLIDDRGDVTIESVEPGRYVLGLDTPVPRLVSAMLGGVDILDAPFDVGTRDLSGLVLRVADGHTELSGSITGGRQSTVAPGTVVLFAADQRYWEVPNRRVSAVRPGSDGSFVFRDVPPGAYQLGLVTGGLGRSDLTSDLLTGLLPVSVPVAIVENVPVVQNFRIGE